MKPLLPEKESGNGTGAKMLVQANYHSLGDGFATLQALIGTDKLIRRFPASVFVAASPDPGFVPVHSCFRGMQRNSGHKA
ncbi:hypothetical protein THH46_07625 [Pseudomonas sp. NA13]